MIIARNRYKFLKQNKPIMRRHVLLFILLSYVLLFTFILYLLGPKDREFPSEMASENRVYFTKSDVKEMLLENPEIVYGILEEINRKSNRREQVSYKNVILTKKQLHSEVKGMSEREQKEMNYKDTETEYEQENTSYGQKENKDEQEFTDLMTTTKEYIEEELGEMGMAAKLGDLTKNESIEKNLMWDLHRFDAYLSQKISIHRKLPDMRDKECKEPGRYSDDLPSTSIIVCLHNEDWSVLLRLVHSILSRTKEELLQEIILIDDFSTMEHLKKPLDDYMSEVGKVKVIHTEERLGIVKARILGAKAAKAPVLTFLDSHCEVTDGWLEPLLDTVKRNRTTAVVPIIEIINEKDFRVKKTICKYAQVGGFKWSLEYTWHLPTAEDRKSKQACDNVRSPTMAGGLFSIDGQYFKDIGYYDENMEVWGGENLGLSFKIWMCGGRIEIAPCSHIGHIFRDTNPYIAKSMERFGNFITRNLNRVAEAWLDDWKEYFYKHKKLKYDVDVSKELALRKTLKCKSFQWYLENVYPTQFQPQKALALGQLRPVVNQELCLHSTEDEEGYVSVKLEPCYGTSSLQFWYFTTSGEIRTQEKCFDHPTKGNFIMYECHGSGGNQYWTYDPWKNQIYHPHTNECLAFNLNNKTLTTQKCELNLFGKWIFQEVRKKEMKKWLNRSLKALRNTRK